MLVTPLRDGMNLVAKEYVACRLDDTGVLVLSEFTGAADELTEAFIVNPLRHRRAQPTPSSRALRMPAEEPARCACARCAAGWTSTTWPTGRTPSWNRWKSLRPPTPSRPTHRRRNRRHHRWTAINRLIAFRPQIVDRMVTLGFKGAGRSQQQRPASPDDRHGVAATLWLWMPTFRVTRSHAVWMAPARRAAAASAAASPGRSQRAAVLVSAYHAAQGEAGAPGAIAIGWSGARLAGPGPAGRRVGVTRQRELRRGRGSRSPYPVAAAASWSRPAGWQLR